MDVVKKCVERLRGKDRNIQPVRQGSSFHMKLPLTMAIIDGMIVQIGAERYIVPTIALKESFRSLGRPILRSRAKESWSK